MAMKDTLYTAEDTAVYLTECTLATIERMACARRRPSGEFQRQIAIAQTGMNMLRSLHIDITLNKQAIRVRELSTSAHSVKDWADAIIAKRK